MSGKEEKTANDELVHNDCDTCSAFQARLTTLRDIMHRDVVTVGKDENIISAAKLMSDRNISCIVVVEGAEIAGIVTETDFLRKVVASGEKYSDLTVEHIMTSPVVSLCDSVGLVDASEIMSENQVKRLAVTDGGKLVGIVTQTDILQATTTHIYTDISSIMTETVACIDQNETITQAADHMTAKKISCLVAVDEGKVTGIITERDILKKIVADAKSASSVRVCDIMAGPVISVIPDCSTFSTSKVMQSNGIRRLLVMEGDKLHGIVTQTDIFIAAKRVLEEQKKQIMMISEGSENGTIFFNSKGIITYF